MQDGTIDQAEMLFITEERPKSWKRHRFYAEEIYRNARFTMDRYFCYDDISHVPAALFQIRQSIEIRLWEIFGIQWFTDKNDDPAKVIADKLMELDGLDKNIDLHVKISNLKLIYKWTNVYVHAGITHKYWQIHFASEYIKRFIYETAVAMDEYLQNLNSIIEDMLHGLGVKNISWRKEKDCVSETQKKQQDAFEKKAYERLKKL